MTEKTSFSGIKGFLKTSIIGGLLVILPVTIFLFALRWLYRFVSDGVAPLTQTLFPDTPEGALLQNAAVIILIIGTCFIVGVFVRTKLGRLVYTGIENRILRKAPGYSLIKETVSQFIGDKKSPFSSVAMVKIYGNDTLMTAFVTDTHDDGSYTVFVPTGPNPTSGNIYHLKGKYVQLIDIPVETVMRSIISCGAGSSNLLAAMQTGKRK